MKRLILVVNGKGGVGKSFVAVNLVQYLKDRKVAHVGIDTDNENSTLKRFHPDAAFVDIESPRERDSIFEQLGQHALGVVDCRAATTDLLLAYFAEVNLREVLRSLETQLTLAIPINHEADSVDQVQRWAAALTDVPAYLIIRNAVHSESFALYQGLGDRRRLVEELGAREIDFPRLPPWIVEALNRENLTPTGARPQHPRHVVAPACPQGPPLPQSQCHRTRRRSPAP